MFFSERLSQSFRYDNSKFSVTLLLNSGENAPARQLTKKQSNK